MLVNYWWLNVFPPATCCFGQTELYGRTFNVSFFGANPYVKVDYSRPVPLYGSDFDIMVLLARKFQFRPSILAERDWGVRLGNGTWTGTVGSVAAGRSLMGFGHIGLTHERYQAIDFSVPTYLCEYGYFTTLPRRLPPFKNIVAPFTNLVWGIFAGAVVGVAAAFVLVHSTYSFHQVPYAYLL